jgi:hypothetical protein
VVNKRPLTELCSLLAIRILAKLPIAVRIFKGLSKDGGQADFSSSPSLINTYSMNLISARSISLDIPLIINLNSVLVPGKHFKPVFLCFISIFSDLKHLPLNIQDLRRVKAAV